MANEEHLAILKQGAEAWNRWRARSVTIHHDFSHASLRGAKLRSADLHKATFSHASLISADLRGADLYEATFSHASLSEADLRGADLSGAVLSDVNLYDTNLTRTVLQNADFTGARLAYAIFADTDLSKAKGLDLVRHEGPSTIGIDTLYKSGGNIPEVFLRGCGLSDWGIESAKLYKKDLSPGQATDIAYRLVELRTNPAIQFNSCFISYSSLDQKFSETLYTDLQKNGVRCWFAPEHMKIGDRIRDRIDEAIRLQDKLLLVLSETSIESQWVEQEVETALEKERIEKRTILCPIRLDEAVMNTNAAWASFIKKTRHIGDFNRWHDKAAYQKAFNRLLRDLKAEEK